MDYLSGDTNFNNLSLRDLLEARDQFHVHLMHKANVRGTAVGRYLIRKSDPLPSKDKKFASRRSTPKPPRTIENSEIRDYSWPCVLVFVSQWVEARDFDTSGSFSAEDFLPSAIYLEDGRKVPLCVVQASAPDAPEDVLSLESLEFPSRQLSGGYPVLSDVQKVTHLASLGCLVTDGHKVYALTNRHVVGERGEVLFTLLEGKRIPIGHTADRQLGRLPFEKVYASWPGKQVYVNCDVGLIEVDDLTRWSASVYGIGPLGPLADLSVFNLSLNIIGCPVRAHGCASGRLSGRIAGLFYRYRSVGGFEYVADFLIGSRDEQPLRTKHGDSGAIWVLEHDEVERDRMPVAIQWGGTVFAGETESFPFALATNLSTVCRELELDIFRSSAIGTFEYWGAVGHYTIASVACDLVSGPRLKKLLTANRDRISFKLSDITPEVKKVTTPGFVPLADVPDKVWKKFKTAQTPYGRRGPENPNHYADIDFPDNNGQTLNSLTPSANALLPQTWRGYYKSIGWNSVSERGLLPFRVWQIYKQMVEFVHSNKIGNYVAAAGVLAHYVGDACQPLHGSYLADGDPFRNADGSPSTESVPHKDRFGAGVHTAYEDAMLDAKVSTLLEKLTEAAGQAAHGMPLIAGGQAAGFEIIELIRRTHATIAPADIVQLYGDLRLQGKANTAVTKLWSKFGQRTVQVMEDGCKTLAMLWESAWTEGGGDNLAATDMKAIGQNVLKNIYERQEFLPSAPLGQIDQYL